MEYDWEKKSTRPALPFDCTCFAAKISKYQMPNDQIMEYKRSTLQLGLEAGNVNKSEKNHHNGSYSIVHLETV